MSVVDPTQVAAAEPTALDPELGAADGWTQRTEIKAGEPHTERVEVVRVFGGPAEAPAGGAAMAVPPPALAVPTRTVSGRYRSEGTTLLEVRVDVDGPRPLRRLSGDVYTRSGATLYYFGSFRVDTLKFASTTDAVVVEGTGIFTWGTSAPRVRVTIPRSSVLDPPEDALVEFLTPGGFPGGMYTCSFESSLFRTVQLEEDSVAGVTPFSSYYTGWLPSPPPARTLSVVASYAEAGIEMQPASLRNLVSTAGIGPSWSDTELHNAMVANFSLWADVPQWKVWMFHALLHDAGPGLLGIMFDQQGPQRQGCAAFYAGLGGTTPERLRLQLYTCVHELGHCFNLFHSFHKEFMNPPQPNRPLALSWMNYPFIYPSGEAAFWAAFPFQFDTPELVHLRHGFRANVIMGGNPFGTGAALEAVEVFEPPVEDNSGLLLELRGRPGFVLGEPVRVELKLSSTDLRGRVAHANLHPNFGFVQVAIRQPGGRVVLYRPMIEHCAIPARRRLRGGGPALYESAYVGYGKDGLYFDTPGMYQLRAVYHAPDGSRVVSNTLALRIRSPVTRKDDAVADLLLGEEQGALFYLNGSDSPFLRRGSEALETVLEHHGDHPLATYARVVRGANALREFKTITPDGRIRARAPDHAAAIRDLGAAVEENQAEQVLDNIALNRTMRRLADAYEGAGDEAQAVAVADRMVDYFRGKGLNPAVLATVEAQAAAYAPGEGHLSAPERWARSNHLELPPER